MQLRIDHNAESEGWLRKQVASFRQLKGRTLRRWVGSEMAFLDVGKDGLPQWEHESAPMLQMGRMDLEFEDDLIKMTTYQNFDQCALYIIDDSPPLLPGMFEDPMNIFRVREIPELPTGIVDDVEVVLDQAGDIAEIHMTVANRFVRMRAGEFWEEEGGAIRLCEREESILVQVDGKRPR